MSNTPETAVNHLVKIDSYSIEPLRDLFVNMGYKRFRADQVYEWIHGKGVKDFDEMTNVSVKAREELKNVFEFTPMETIKVQRSEMDGSIKVLIRLEDGNLVESVVLADYERNTGCISTQVGCRMGCTFCSTAKMGFERNLSVAEIVGQVAELNRILAEEDRRLTNLVFMGMGEPLDNSDNLLDSIRILMDRKTFAFSHKRITVSTCGLTDKMMRLFELETPVNLAVSINAATQEKREQIMPVTKKYPLKDLIKGIKRLPSVKRKMIMAEYVLMKGFNDTPEDAKALAAILKGIRVKVNLIPYNSGMGGGYEPPSENETLKFQDYLIQEKIGTFIRKSLGSDIDGACGQLYANTRKEEENG
ncbi:23S rRNA (adenine(2503)-C(2))-methyltransferase RlmN [Limisalsivibrio acetivorans]|uniref:23S rRNA (adenine(2503)-C(2))-methyltransferase RlmN n=1 Tax=Limisalsivibrio acetivorans TaxID=1304888 RepID=UPI0003B5BF90|nr:23S rRNA (adenine(2503)-C(2))-methyltransferase RlmN [Limisalsivibrio acetivorans]